jgi:hypothetical protein
MVVRECASCQEKSSEPNSAFLKNLIAVSEASSSSASLTPRIPNHRSFSGLSPGVSGSFWRDGEESEEFEEIDSLSGLLGREVSEEILQHEYPMILTAHATCEQEEPMFDENADQTTPLIHNPPQLHQNDKMARKFSAPPATSD